jgi:amino acid transporter
VFSDLGGAYPISGGPQAFVQRAFGDLAGLEASFLYWVSTITTNAAYATGFVAYLAIFFPSFAASLPAQIAGQLLLWTFCGVNACGVRAVGHTQLVGTLLKAAPLVILAIAPSRSWAASGSLAPFARTWIGINPHPVGLVSFLFLGSESATVPAEEVRGGGPA